MRELVERTYQRRDRALPESAIASWFRSVVIEPALAMSAILVRAVSSTL
jgi:hypothetical protein